MRLVAALRSARGRWLGPATLAAATRYGNASATAAMRCSWGRRRRRVLAAWRFAIPRSRAWTRRGWRGGGRLIRLRLLAARLIRSRLVGRALGPRRRGRVLG